MLTILVTILGGSAAAAAVANFMVRAAAAGIWREQAEALEARVAQLEHERSQDKLLIRRLIRVRDALKRRVLQLTLRVSELERRLHEAGIGADPP